MTEGRTPILIALLNDFPVVVEGIARMLEGDPRLSIVELDSKLDPKQQIDVVLYDAFATGTRQMEDLTRLLGNPRYRHVAVYTWHVNEEQRQALLYLGVSGFLSKAMGAGELADALVQVGAGHRTIVDTPVPEDVMMADWPGRVQGLSARESEVVALITKGITNEEIAQACYLSINSVKSYIRSAYRKMGVQRRSQAVLWGVEHGFQPMHMRKTVDS